jgi:hypothetical protein
VNNRRKGDRAHRLTVDLLHAWVGIGVFARLVFVIAIIGACMWLAANVYATLVWFNSLLKVNLP